MVSALFNRSRRVLADISATLRKHTIVTLMYHSISVDPLDQFAVPPDLFRRHIDAIVASGLPTISTREMLSMIRGDQPMRRSICLTFDDGLDDFGDAAVPVLAEHALPASLFVSTALVGVTATWTTWSDSRRFHDWAELRDLANNGIEIGSHARTHHRLSALPTNHVNIELQQSRDDLSHHLRTYLNVLAYPYGDHSPTVRRLTHIAKYDAAYGVGGLWANRRGTDLYQLRRVAVTSSTSPEQIASIVRGYPDWRIALGR